MELYVKSNELVGDETVEQSFVVDLDLVKKTWSEPDQIDENSDKWPGTCPNGSKEQMAKWLDRLAQNGFVSDTEETLCWAVAKTPELCDTALKDEIAKWN